MKRLSWRSILQRVEGRRIAGLWYGLEDGYLRLELDDGSVLLVAASWEEGYHVVVDPAVPATRKGRPTKEPPPISTSSWSPKECSYPLSWSMMLCAWQTRQQIRSSWSFAEGHELLRQGVHPRL